MRACDIGSDLRALLGDIVRASIDARDLYPTPHGFVRSSPNFIRRCRYGERCECPVCNPGADAHSNHDPGDEDRS